MRRPFSSDQCPCRGPHPGLAGWLGSLRLVLTFVAPLLAAGRLTAAVHIHEIMYNPPQGSQYEYVELFNGGASSENLEGWALVGGVEFLFPAGTRIEAGGYVIVVRSAEAVAAAYPNLPESVVAGEFAGRLGNEGERLAVIDAGGGVVEELVYDDDSPWEFLADGFGSSLERVCVESSAALPESWVASPVPRAPEAFGGSPAAANAVRICPPAPSPRPPVYLSELMYHPVLEEALEDLHEFIEIHNAGTGPVSLEGWRLAGGVDYTFAAGATVAAGGYLVVAKSRLRLLDVPGYDLDGSLVVGDYARTLDNGGEKVALIDADGHGVDSVTYDDDFPWPVGADGLGAGRSWLPDDLLPLETHRYRGRSLERVSFERPAGELANWAPSPLDGATPGRPNASARVVPLAIVASAEARPVGAGERLIRSGDEVRVEVTFSPADFRGAVELEYFVEDVSSTDEPTERIALNDDGVFGDPVAGDGRYSALLPPRGDNTIVRYRLSADRGTGMEEVSPRPSDPHDWHAYFVSPEIGSDTRTYQVFIDPVQWGRMWTNINFPTNSRRVAGCAERASWNARVPAIFVHEGRVYDAQVRYQGSRWNRPNGRTISSWRGPRPTAGPLLALSWRIALPRYNQLDGVGVITLNKLTQGCPGYNAAVGYRLFEMAGIPSSRTQFVRLHVNGQYYHYMIQLERPGEEMMRRAHREEAENNPGQPREPVGHLFKSVGCTCDEGPFSWGDWRLIRASCGYTAEARYAATYDRKTHDWDGPEALVALIEGLHEARRGGLAEMRAYLEENFDIDLLLSYVAIINWSVPFDDMFQNHFLYQRQSDGKWFLMPWDLDQNFGAGWRGDTGRGAAASIYIGQQGDPDNRSGWWHVLKDTVLRSMRTEYEDHLLLLNNTILHPDVVAGLVDDVAAQINDSDWQTAPAGFPCSFTSEPNRFKNYANQRFTAVNRTIANVSVDAGENQTVFVGSTVQFDATGTTPEPGPDVSYVWSNGMEGATPTFTYTEPGVFEETLRVTSRGVEFTDTVVIEVLALPDLVHLERDGLVVIEAESFHANERRGSEEAWWELDTERTPYSGAGYMEAKETRRQSWTRSYAGESPELRYVLRFENTGPYHVWMRGFSDDRRRDTVHVNFFSRERSSGFAQKFTPDETSFTWSAETNREGPQILEVPSPGIYLLSLWMWESGIIIDKIVMTRDAAFAPEALGPGESPRGSPSGKQTFVRGDVNGTGRLEILDAILLSQQVFLSASAIACEDHGDVDDNGRLEPADLIGLLRYEFLDGDPPAPPFPGPGFDPTGDAYTCGDG